MGRGVVAYMTATPLPIADNEPVKCSELLFCSECDNGILPCGLPCWGKTANEVDEHAYCNENEC